MKKIHLSFALITLTTMVEAQELNWAFNVGNSTNYSHGGRAIAADNYDNTFTIGFFAGVVDFDPSVTATYNLGMGSINSSFILKSNPLGETVWAGSFQSNVAGGNAGVDITTDNNNRIISTGTFRGITDFDPGAGTVNIDAMTTGSNRTYISILNNDGTFVWAGALLGSGVNPTGIGTDASGNIFLTGNFDGTVDFDPGAGTFELTSATASSGNDAFFVMKLAANGDFIWAKNIDGPVESTDLAVDSNGDVWVSGIFEATVDFDPGAGVNSKTSLGDTDGFTLKLNGTTGSADFLSIVGGYNADGAYALTIQNNIVYTTGTVYQEAPFENRLDLDPSANTNYITGFPSAATALGFIQLLDLSGNYVNGFGLAGDAKLARSIAVNAFNEMYVTGGIGYGLFEAKFNSSGNLVWSHAISNNINEGTDVVLTSTSVIFTGIFTTYGDFDPSAAGVFNLSCSGGPSNVYVQSLKDNNTNGIEEIELKNIKIFPNPSSGIYNLESDTEIRSIVVYSNTGTNVFSTDSMIETIDLTDYPSGIYFIKAKGIGSSETTVRVIKN